MLSRTSELNLELPVNLTTTYTVLKGVLGIHIEIFYWGVATNAPKHIWGLTTPLQMKEIHQMEQSHNWKDWEQYFPSIPLSDISASIDKAPQSLDIDMKMVVWNVCGASKDEFMRMRGTLSAITSLLFSSSLRLRMEMKEPRLWENLWVLMKS